MEVRKFAQRVIFYVLGLITAISLFFIYMSFVQKTEALESLVGEKQRIYKNIYNQIFETLYEKYETIGINLLSDPLILDAIEKNDGKAIYRITNGLYEKLRKNNPYLNIMHFHDADSRSILRLHKPDRSGDDLSSIRSMIEFTNRTHQKQTGLEIGKYGISYRIALPIKKGNRHIGVLELGIDARYIVDTLNDKYDIQSMLLLQKEAIREYTDSNRDVKMETVGDFAVITSNFNPFKNFVDIDSLSRGYRLISADNNDNLVFKGSDIYDFHDEVIGQILLVKKMNFFTKNMKIMGIVLSLSAVLLIALSYILLRYGFSFFIKRIEIAQKRLIQKNRILERITNIDHLTKAYNRRHIDKVLESEFKRSKRYSLPLSIILFDVDNFKAINDTHGHNKGDKVLRTISKLISNAIRESDHFGRWGGEEFIIVSTETTPENAVALAEKLRKIIESYKFEDIGQIGCSFGIAECDKKEPIDTSIHDADKALYEAKRMGKNRVVCWSSDME